MSDLTPLGAGEPADIDELAATLRANAADLDIYARVLTSALADGLPAGMVVVDRDQSLRDRLAGRPGEVRKIRIEFGETALELERGTGGQLSGRCARAVRGVVISSKEVGFEEWTRLFTANLAKLAKESDAARSVLGKLLGQSG
jgi:hypothetical protein